MCVFISALIKKRHKLSLSLTRFFNGFSKNATAIKNEEGIKVIALGIAV